jgi:hypothetical protein
VLTLIASLLAHHCWLLQLLQLPGDAQSLTPPTQPHVLQQSETSPCIVLLACSPSRGANCNGIVSPRELQHQHARKAALCGVQGCRQNTKQWHKLALLNSASKANQAQQKCHCLLPSNTNLASRPARLLEAARLRAGIQTVNNTMSQAMQKIHLSTRECSTVAC